MSSSVLRLFKEPSCFWYRSERMERWKTPHIYAARRPIRMPPFGMSKNEGLTRLVLVPTDIMANNCAFQNMTEWPAQGSCGLGWCVHFRGPLPGVENSVNYRD